MSPLSTDQHGWVRAVHRQAHRQHRRGQAPLVIHERMSSDLCSSRSDTIPCKPPVVRFLSIQQPITARVGAANAIVECREGSGRVKCSTGVGCAIADALANAEVDAVRNYDPDTPRACVSSRSFLSANPAWKSSYPREWDGHGRGRLPQWTRTRAPGDRSANTELCRKRCFEM